jgi:hypothetical protein
MARIVWLNPKRKTIICPDHPLFGATTRGHYDDLDKMTFFTDDAGRTFYQETGYRRAFYKFSRRSGGCAMYREY